MSDLIPIKDQLGLLRDPKTNSIVNVSKSQYNNYLRLKEQKRKEKENHLNLEEEVLKLKDDINEIKIMLKSILNQ
jgi:hypothetical protein